MKILHLNGKPLFALQTAINLQEKRVYLSEYGNALGKVSLRFFDSKEGDHTNGSDYFQWVEVNHPVVIKDQFAYRPGPDGYAQYFHKRKGWVSSAKVSNDSLGPLC